ncbi:MAG: RluA family pseudouridine synthase [Actinobacteria bacterium]|nr:RluA family pseudouridine synthase [Actinomycetota bacterium]
MDSGQDDERLDVVVSALLGDSRTSVAARIQRGDIRVNGRQPAKSERLREGDVIEVTAPAPEPTGAAGVAPPPVRYEDDHILVVAKPPGLVIHPGTGHPAGTLVQALAEAGYDLAPAGGPTRPGIVHRLDRDTSGLLVVAKTDGAYHGLVEALRERAVERRYVALVQGVPGASTGRIDVPIDRDPRDRKRFAALSHGKPAVTRWQVLGEGTVPGLGAGRDTVTLVACTLETGRTHQIRVHMAYAGHPIVGDPVYGATGDVASALGLQRPFLHAARLGLDHPITGERVEFEEPLPDDLRAAARRASLEPG